MFFFYDGHDFSWSFGHAQQQNYSSDKFRYKNTVQLELMGLGVAYSLNYERNVVNLAHTKISFQVGASYLPPSTGWINLSFPVGINQLFSFNRYHIEFGIATMFTFSQEGKKRLLDYSFENFLAV